jgi:hypothetical protein
MDKNQRRARELWEYEQLDIGRVIKSVDDTILVDIDPAVKEVDLVRRRGGDVGNDVLVVQIAVEQVIRRADDSTLRDIDPPVQDVDLGRGRVVAPHGHII